MTRILPRLASALLAVEHYGNPLGIAWGRLFCRPKDVIYVIDRETGVCCECAQASHHMFGDTWYTRVYDVPGVPICPGDVVVDIGANQGFFTCYAAQKGATVYAFEPVPELFERMERNVRRNGFERQVTSVQCAVGEANGETEMYVSESLGGGQSTIRAEFVENARVPVREVIRVPCMTLPRIFTKFGLENIRECKIDAEGSELAILRTLTPELQRRIDAFAMEYHPEAYDVRSLVRLATGWGTHQVGFMEEKPYTGNILRMALTQVYTGRKAKAAAV